jgi:hypothetical protein
METNRPPTTPGLLELGLSAENLGYLARQGFVARERRGERDYFKLRFRRGGRQVVRGLGTDPQLAAQIRNELQQLQADRRAELHLAKLDREARRRLRAAKQALQPHLESRGLHFHGLAIRRSRSGSRCRET